LAGDENTNVSTLPPPDVEQQQKHPSDTVSAETGPDVESDIGTEPVNLPPFRVGGEDPSLMSLVRAGVAELANLPKTKDFPPFFARLAAKTGLRMLLLKRWKSGLQVIMEQGVSLPAEAKQKRADGRAPIPPGEDDVFTAIGKEASVYAGPVPVKHFPLDLTLLLGRSSKDRQIIIIPIPAKNRWNAFVYLDAGQADENVLVAVEILAHYALDRMALLNHGDIPREGQVAGMLKTELSRRQQSQAKRAQLARQPVTDPSGAAGPVPSDPADTANDDAVDGGPLDDGVAAVAVTDSTRSSSAADRPAQKISPGGRPVPSSPEQAARALAARAEAEDIIANWEKAVLNRGGADADADNEPMPIPPCLNLVAEEVLQSSGELPALPEAACHIMAVIEDPRTTATKLEKAVALDQTLTAKVLRIANSPFYGAVREIKTVSEAIVRLGFVTIRNWTLVTATKSVFMAPGSGLLLQRIWRQSVLSAMASQLVAQAVRLHEPETVFIGGLMQNIGQLVLARSQPELFQTVLEVSAAHNLPYHEVEQRLIGFDHGALGALLIRDWNLSRDLEEAVRWHHRVDDEAAQNRRLAAMIGFGEEIAACSGSGQTPDTDEGKLPDSAAARYLGITVQTYARLTEQARELSIDSSLFS